MIEVYRMKRMAALVVEQASVLDIGWVDIPNRFLKNQRVIGLDLQSGNLPDNYEAAFVGNVMDLPRPFAPNEFAAVAAGEIIEHLESPIDFLRGCYNVLKPTGKLVLSTPNPNSPIERLLTLKLTRKYFYAPDHVMLYPQRWLMRMMELAGFVDVELYLGGFPTFRVGLIPFPRPWCYQTIAMEKT